MFQVVETYLLLEVKKCLMVLWTLVATTLVEWNCLMVHWKPQLMCYV